MEKIISLAQQSLAVLEVLQDFPKNKTFACIFILPCFGKCLCVNDSIK